MAQLHRHGRVPTALGFWIGLRRALPSQFPVSVIDGVKQTLKARRFIYRPEGREVGSESRHVIVREQRHSHNSTLHNLLPSRLCGTNLRKRFASRRFRTGNKFETLQTMCWPGGRIANLCDFNAESSSAYPLPPVSPAQRFVLHLRGDQHDAA
jgi:hypothetical protein